MKPVVVIEESSRFSCWSSKHPGVEFVIDLRYGWPGDDAVQLMRWWKAYTR